MSNDAYLTKGKMPLLNAPGVSYSGILYSTFNSSLDEIETRYLQGHFVQDIASKNFGATNTILIDNSLYIGTTTLFLELYPDSAAGGDPNGGDAATTLQTDTYMPPGWGYNAIDYIEFSVGASNTVQRITGAANWAAIAAQCTDEPERSELWKLGGEFRNPIVANGQPQDAIRAYVLLALPWSSAHSKLPYPADVVRNPINVIIKFKDRDYIIGGKGVKASAFKQAKILCRQAEVDRARSLCDMMQESPDLVYSYPATSYKQYSVSNISSMTDPTVTNQYLTFQQQIQNIENADLLGIAIQIVPDSQLQTTTTGATVPSAPLNPYIQARTQSLDILYNGNYIYRSSTTADMYKLANVGGDQGNSSWKNKFILPGANSPWNAVDQDSYFVFVDFSRYRAAALPDDIPNVPRYPSQQFLISWSIAPIPVGAAVPTFTLFYTYFYTAMISAQGGVTTYYTA